jgi:hypothetical protein
VLDPLQEFQKPLGGVCVVILPVPQNRRHASLETLPEHSALMLLLTAQDDDAGIRCRLQLCLGDDRGRAALVEDEWTRRREGFGSVLPAGVRLACSSGATQD